MNLKSPPTEEEGSSKPENAYTYIAGRYGIGYSSMDIKFEINRDGSATVTRTVEIESFSNLETLDTYLLIPEESANGSKREIESIGLEPLSSEHTVSITKIKKVDHTQVLSAILTISPPLQHGAKFKYEMKEQLPLGLYAFDLSPEQLAVRKDPYDYAGWSISRPSKKLCLNVHFPEYIQPVVYNSQVKYAAASAFPAERIQHEEQNNLKAKMETSPNGTHSVFNLEVEYPMIGLIYILRWKTPANSSFH